MTAAAGKTTVKLLLVEDNPLVLELVFRGLEHVCDVMVAHDGGDALLKTIDDPPDVILSDYKMPGIDGRQLFDKLRGRDGSVRIEEPINPVQLDRPVDPSELVVTERDLRERALDQFMGGGADHDRVRLGERLNSSSDVRGFAHQIVGNASCAAGGAKPPASLKRSEAVASSRILASPSSVSWRKRRRTKRR